MKNILFIHQSSEMYGSDKVLLLLCTEIKKRTMYHSIVILPEYGPLFDELTKVGIEVHIGNVTKINRSCFTPLGLVKTLKSVFCGFKDLNAALSGRDVSIVYSNTLAVFTGAFWSLLKQKKHLWHVHEIILSPKLISNAFPFLVNIFSDLVVSNSTVTEAWLCEKKSDIKQKSKIVFNGLPELLPPSADSVSFFRESISAKNDDIVISLVGRVNHWKGQSLLLDALSILNEKKLLENVKVAIVGDTVIGKEYLLDELKSRVKLSGLEHVVNFISFTSDIWPVWFGSDIAVIPSTEPEPFGMVAIEAMSASKPVVAAGHGGLIDIVDDNRTGLLFTPRDEVDLSNKLAILLKSESLRKSFGIAGSVKQKQVFSLTTQVDEIISCFDYLK